METENGDMVDESAPFLEENSREGSCSNFIQSYPLGCSEYNSTRAFLRSVLRVEGLTICVSEATVTTQWRLGRCFPRIWPPKTLCDRAVALMYKGGMHLVSDVDGIAGMQLLRVITGAAPCTSGSILANGVPVGAGVFRRVVGVISGIETSMPIFTVEDNINFVIFMSKRVNPETRSDLVKAVCIIAGLDRSKKAKSLSKSELFRLSLAMELVRDPPVIIAYYPLDNLSHMEAVECGAALKRVSSVLKKTVIISCRSLSTHLFGIADTVLLFGRAGSVLYSGEAGVMPSYFNRLPSYESSTLESSRDGEDPFSSFPLYANCRKSDGFSSEASWRGTGRSTISTRFSVAFPEVRSREFFVLTGDDALDLANMWAENEDVTRFYSNFYSSFHRCIIVQLIERNSVLPMDNKEKRPFLSPASPQYGVLKPVFLLWYDILHVWRDPSAYIYLGSLALGVLLISLLMHYQLDDQGGMYNIRGVLFLLFFMTVMSNIESMADTGNYLRLYTHQRDSGLYHTFCFLVVFVFRAIIIRAVCLALFVPAVIYGLKMNALLLVLIGFVSLAHAFLHVAVHALVPWNSWARFFLYMYVGYCVIFSGFLINLKSLPSFVGSVSVLRWGYGAALEQNLRDVPFSCDGAQSTSYCYTGNAYLDIEGFLEDSTSYSVTVLSVMCVVLLFAINVALVFRK